MGDRSIEFIAMDYSNGSYKWNRIMEYDNGLYKGNIMEYTKGVYQYIMESDNGA